MYLKASCVLHHKLFLSPPQASFMAGRLSSEMFFKRCTGWRFRTELFWLLAIVKLESHILNIIQNSSVSGVESWIVTRKMWFGCNNYWHTYQIPCSWRGVYRTSFPRLPLYGRLWTKDVHVQGVPSARGPGLTLILMFHCLPDSAWSNGNMAVAARQLDMMVEHVNQSQPNPGPRADGTPCIKC